MTDGCPRAVHNIRNLHNGYNQKLLQTITSLSLVKNGVNHPAVVDIISDQNAHHSHQLQVKCTPDKHHKSTKPKVVRREMWRDKIGMTLPAIPNKDRLKTIKCGKVKSNLDKRQSVRRSKFVEDRNWLIHNRFQKIFRAFMRTRDS
jgi:hypothetical protein